MRRASSLYITLPGAMSCNSCQTRNWNDVPLGLSNMNCGVFGLSRKALTATQAILDFLLVGSLANSWSGRNCWQLIALPGRTSANQPTGESNTAPYSAACTIHHHWEMVFKKPVVYMHRSITPKNTREQKTGNPVEGCPLWTREAESEATEASYNFSLMRADLPERSRR